MKYSLAVVLLLATGTCSQAWADDASPSGDEAAIRQTVESYVQAFNARDAQALAAIWSPEAVYTNRLSGEQVVGREAIAEQFNDLFAAEKDLKLKVDVSSIEFVSPNVAVENGVATFLLPDAEPDQVDYSAVYIQRDGKWLLDRVTDDPKPVVRSNYDHLKDLEWMVGNWVDEDGGGKVVTECSWAKNKNFMTRSFTVSVGDRIGLSGMQLIGWDPAEKHIRSWTFDSDGGFSEGRWTKNGNRWYIRKKGTTADGSRATAVNIVTVIDDGSFTLQSTQRTLAGELLPNVGEVIVVRK